MSEETAAPPSESADPVAVSLALAGASRDEADAFLRDQRRHMHEQLQQIHLDVWEKKLGVALRLATLVVGLALALGVAVAMWNAAHADGLVVEAMSIPPRFAEAGISGEVVADDLMTKVGAIRAIAVAQSLDESKEVSRDRDQDIKVEIPETGVSLGQAWHYLRLWLGHERRVTGNLRTAGDGTLALNITLGGQEVFTATGNAADLDKLEQQAAEHLFAAVDPLNYCLYLLVQNRPETLAAAERATQLARSSPERADAYSLFAFLTRLATGDMALVAARTRLAMAIDPKIATPHVEMIRDSILLGHDEDGLAEARALTKFRAEDQLPLQRGRGFQEILFEAARERDVETGDFAQAQSEKCVDCSLSAQSLLEAEYAARNHDAAGSGALIEKARAAGGADKALGNSRAQIGRARYFQAAAADDWRAAAADARAYAALIATGPRMSAKLSALQVQTLAMPLLAQALAGSGDLSGAGTAIAATPGDCYNCIRTRGLVAAAAKQWGRSDYWFARAVQAAPSVPFAYTEWGQSLLARGKADLAIAQFKLANRRGPHFADPLEGWGEALTAKNQSHLALVKFMEAEKYAPNWARLHLKWGEALLCAGKAAEARAQFARAAQLDLTPSEKAELVRTNHV